MVERYGVICCVREDIPLERGGRGYGSKLKAIDHNEALTIRWLRSTFW